MLALPLATEVLPFSVRLLPTSSVLALALMAAVGNAASAATRATAAAASSMPAPQVVVVQ